MDLLHHVEGPQGEHLEHLRQVGDPLQVGLLPSDLYDITGPEDAANNAERLERIWAEERRRCEGTAQEPSLSR